MFVQVWYDDLKNVERYFMDDFAVNRRFFNHRFKNIFVRILLDGVISVILHSIMR